MPGAGFGLIWLAQALHRRELHKLAQTDSLTGLLNRRAFEDILARELRRTQRAAKPVAALLVDIDRFKNVNDTWGHHAGDEVIRRVALALRDSLRPGDTLSRFGGEEFMILIRDTTAEQSAEVAKRLCMNIAELADMPGNLRMTVSIGVAESNKADTPEELLRRCDHAMYLSKKGGRNLVTVDRSINGPTDLAPTQISAQTAKTYS
jgi:diguanylate cyclase (GGDEF)-like protein